MARLGPGPELEEAVRKGKAAYDDWEQKQKSRDCRDKYGSPLTKPPYLLAGMGKGVAAERWLTNWFGIQLEHNKRCVTCGEKFSGSVQTQDSSPDDGR